MKNKFMIMMGVCSLGWLAPVQAQEQQDRSATEDVAEATVIVQQMQRDPDIANALAKAKGVFLVPDYASAALIVGGSGGEGVLIEKLNDGWSNPAFYDIGSGSIGLQAGVSVGSIALLLMSDKAVDSFKDENAFSITAQAGLSIINWSARAQAETGDLADVVVWTDTEGLLAEASVGFTDINFDEEETIEYYGSEVTLSQALAGNVKNPHGDMLSQALKGGG